MAGKGNAMTLGTRKALLAAFLYSPVVFLLVYFTLVGEYAATFTALIFGMLYLMTVMMVVDVLDE